MLASFIFLAILVCSFSWVMAFLPLLDIIAYHAHFSFVFTVRHLFFINTTSFYFFKKSSSSRVAFMSLTDSKVLLSIFGIGNSVGSTVHRAFLYYHFSLLHIVSSHKVNFSVFYAHRIFVNWHCCEIFYCRSGGSSTIS